MFEEHQKSLVRASFQCRVQFLQVHARRLGNLRRLLEKVHDELRERRSRHLARLPLAVQYRRKRHNLRNGHAGLRPHTGHAFAKLRQVSGTRRAVLREVVDNRTYRKQTLLRTEPGFISENARQLRKGQRCPLAEFVKCHINLVSRFDEPQNVLFGCFAEAPRLFGESVQVLTARTGVHLFEVLVQFLYLVVGKSREFAHVRHLRVHLRKSIHRLASCHHESRPHRCRPCKDVAPLVYKAIYAVHDARVFLLRFP